MKAIVAVDKKWGIGKNNGLLFSIPEDMKFFRLTTTGKTVIMGVNTLKSFPGGNPLPKRVNIVLDPSGTFHSGCITAESTAALSDIIAPFPQDDIFVIGGAMTYHSLLPYCSEALVTKVEADGAAEVFFDNLDEAENWECVEESDTVETNGYKIKFTKYINSEVLPLNTEQKK